MTGDRAAHFVGEMLDFTCHDPSRGCFSSVNFFVIPAKAGIPLFCSAARIKKGRFQPSLE
jgi:hypothetical protein